MNYRNKITFLLILLLGVNTAIAQKITRTPQKENSTAASYRAGAFIDVNTTNYPESSFSIEQLIKDVLISGGSSCAGANVSNVKVSPNLAASNQNRSWGYFNKGTTNFSFEKGIVLSTGYARKVGNSYISTTLSDNLGSGSDSDLQQAMGGGVNYFDATYVEFDFVPQATQISFNYLFASEEYFSTYPCQGYTDGFALLLKKLGDPNYTNMAVLPGNAGPVSVTNIVPSNYSCGPINAQYFGGLNSSNIETNFNGRTIPLKAVANVIPGQTYHFKMVLGDALDYQFDSAVFLEAGSFNIGVQFQDGAGVTLPSQITMCELTPQTLVAQVQAPNATFKWFFNNVEIPGATTNTYTATQPGIYRVEVYIPGNNCPGVAEVKILAGTFPIAKNTNLDQCSSTNTAVFNLKSAESVINGSSSVFYTYYANQADAEAGNFNNIPNPTNYTSATKKIYVRVSNGSCAKVSELQLNVYPKPATPIIQASSAQICGSSTLTLTSNNSTGNVWSTGETSQSITVSAAGTYTLKIVDAHCESNLASITITSVPDPNIQITGNLSFCTGSSTVLTSSSTTGNVWNTGDTTPSITVNTPGTYTVTVTLPGGCTFTKSVNVIEVPKVDVTIAPPIVMCDNTPQTIVAQSPTATVFAWYFNNVLIPGATGSTYLATQPGIYKVIASIPGNNCPGEAQVTITGGSFPVVTPSSLSECSATNSAVFNLTNAQSSLSTTTGVSFQFYEIKDDADLGNSNFILNPTNYSSTTKKVYVRVTNGSCSKVTELQLTVNPTPATPIITASNTQLCGNSTVTLTSNYATGNIWSTGQTSPSITVSAAGTYTLKVANTFCTSSEASLTIVSVPDPNIQITGDLSFCNGFSTTLTSSSPTGNLWSNGSTGQSITVNIPGDYTLTVTLPGGCQFSKTVTVVKTPDIVIDIKTPEVITCQNNQITLDATLSQYQSGDTFLWTASNGGNIVSGGNTLQPTINSAGTYTLTINGINCSASRSVTVAEDKVSPTISVSADRIKICEGESAILSAVGAPSYVWTGIAGNSDSVTVSPTSTTTYTVTGIGANGCTSAPVSITITVLPKITSDLIGGPICQGGSITLDAGYAPNYTYLWSNGETGQTITVDKVGEYSVTINNTVCSKTFTAQVTAGIPPTITKVIYENNVLTIICSNQMTYPLEYSIDSGVTWQSSNIFSNVQKNTNYHIAVRVKNTTCTTIADYFTYYQYNVITPNNDGINDTIDFTGISFYSEFKAEIFDRMGNVVFKADTNRTIWDGKYLQRPLPSSSYWFLVTWDDPITKEKITKTGWILLKNH